ncbi:family 20 glycosylhydrolase [Clostridium septicum]|uniref:family 20 glycosylhydrolase n=1 Tax=Clostridium septicum TaxID=1504 RepID=UPI003216544B
MIMNNKKLYGVVLSTILMLNSFTCVKAETNLVKKNIVLEPGVIATSSDNETADFVAGKAIDGVVDYQKATGQSRWASNTTSPTEENKKWLKIDLGEVKNFNEIVIDWERKNAINYTIEISDDDTNWKTIKEFTNSPTEYRQVIPLNQEEVARYIRLSILHYSETSTKRDAAGNDKTTTWNTVSVFELEVYSGELVEPSYTIDEVINNISAPVINKGDKKMPMPEVPKDFEIEFIGADYEQIIGADGTIYEPLVNTNVEVNFRVKKGEEERTTSPLNVVVPGKYESNTGNEKPKVIPELAEWHGTEGNFEISDNTKIIIESAYSNELMKTANKFASDYKNILNKEITVEEGTEAVANSFFLTLDTADDGLCSEGNLITIDDSVKIEGKSAQGIFYATRSILQILKQNQTTLPQGVVRDYPKYKVRGFMLDVARKSYELSSLKELAENMAWYKLNDLQVHLNDNFAFLEDYMNDDKSNREDAFDAYAAFRLESNLRNDQGEGITSTDVFYTKNEFRDFIKEARDVSINIVPEIDTPAHSLSITKVFKDLALEGWSPHKPTRPLLDHLDLGNPRSLELVKGLLNEYMVGDNPVFDLDTVVHIGTDEYRTNSEQYRVFTDALLGHVQDSGRVVRMWGGLSILTGETPVRSDDVQLNVWNKEWANPIEMYELGYDLINTIDSELYSVPGADYYRDYLDAQNLYNNWEPNVMAKSYIPAGDNQMLGATYAIWNDQIDKRNKKTSEYDIFDRFYKPLPALAEKMWGDGEDKTFAELNELSSITGTAPNTNPYYTVKSDAPNYVEYSFEEKEILDKSGNNYNSISKKNVSFEAGKKGKALKLNGGESYVETPIKRVGLPNSISFWIKKNGNTPEGEQILFESPSKFDNYAIKAVDANGKVGFTRERNNFSFNYELPDDEWVYLTIGSVNERTMLFVNNKLVDTLGNRPISTLLIPFERIGSITNSFNGLIDEIVVGSELPLPRSNTYEAEDQLVVKEGSFVTLNAEKALNGSQLKTSTENDNLSLEFYGNEVSIYGRKAVGTCIVKVDLYKLVDGEEVLEESVNIDCYKNTMEDQALIYNKSFEENGYYKVKITNTGTKNSNANDAYNMIIDYFVVDEIIDEEVEEVNKTALKITIDYAEELILEGALEDVVPAVVNEFNKALEEAKEVYANEKATEVEVDASFKRLTNVIWMLEFKKGDKKSLQVLVDSAKALVEKEYTSDSWANLQKEIIVAEAVIADENAMQDEVDKALNSLKEAIDSLVKNNVDKSQLESFINKVEGLNKAEYIESTWNKFEKALEVAKNVLADENATQENVNTAYNSLVRAYMELRLIPDKSKLEDLINKIEKMDLSKYTKESVKTLNKELNKANKVLKDKNATQQEIDSVTKSLSLAVDKLEVKEVANSGNLNENNSVNNNTNKNSGKGGNLPNAGAVVSSAIIVILGAVAVISGLVILKRRNRKSE